MRVAVTGPTGFIGTHLLDRLVADGHQVTAFVRSRSAIPGLRLKGVAAVTGDVADVESIRTALTGAEVVFHLARAKAHGSRPREAFAVNVDGTRNVARVATKCGVGRVVHCSSSAIYGTRPGLVSEATEPTPDSGYARSKAIAETVANEELGDRAVIARITAVMGPGARTWLGLLRSARGGTLRLVGDGLNMQHPVDVGDVVEGLMRCAFTADVGGRTYNIAGPEPLPMRDLRDALATAAAQPGDAAVVHPRSYPRALLDAYYHMGRLSDKVFGLRPPLFESVSFLSANRVLDLKRSREELGFVPVVGVLAAARRTAEWMRGEGML